jgi:hypothetical protein
MGDCMRISRRIFVLFLVPLIPASLDAQQQVATSITSTASDSQSAIPQTLQRDPQAVAVLTQTLKAAGGIPALSAIQDYTASGSITYYWGDGEQGSAVVKGRGTGQFRVDASLSDGTRSWAVSNGSGFIKEVDGTENPIAAHNTLNLGSLTIPVVYLVAAVGDASISVSYIGLETDQGIEVHHIQLQHVFPVGTDQFGVRGRLSRRDFFIDSGTFLIVRTMDMEHPKDQADVNYPHEIRFSDYRRVGGILAPFSVAESFGGQPTFTFQVNQIAVNTGLQDTDFQE